MIKKLANLFIFFIFLMLTSCGFKVVNKEQGITTVMIEHDMGVVMDISDHVVVLDYGKKIGDGTPSEVMSNQDVIDAYLGVSH